MDELPNREYRDENPPEISDVVSAQECTGLFPVPPKTDEEAHARRSLSSNELPKNL